MHHGHYSMFMLSGTLKTLGSGSPRPFKLVALEHKHLHNALDT
jgi:hypothetical protein